jgi:hypothetical protein
MPGAMVAPRANAAGTELSVGEESFVGTTTRKLSCSLGGGRGPRECFGERFRSLAGAARPEAADLSIQLEGAASVAGRSSACLQDHCRVVAAACVAQLAGSLIVPKRSGRIGLGAVSELDQASERDARPCFRTSAVPGARSEVCALRDRRDHLERRCGWCPRFPCARRCSEREDQHRARVHALASRAERHRSSHR